MKSINVMSRKRLSRAQCTIGAGMVCLVASSSVLWAQPAPEVGALRGAAAAAHFEALAAQQQAEAEAEAQKAAIPPTVQEVQEAMKQASYENALATPVTLKIDDGDLKKVESELRRALPDLPQLEIRAALPARFSFDLPATPAGDILQAAAKLSGCKLFLIGDKMLIATVSEQSEAERKQGFEWREGVGFANNGGSRRETAKVEALRFIHAELLQRLSDKRRNNPDPLLDAQSSQKMTLGFGQLSADAQGMFKRIMVWQDQQLAAGFPDLYVPARMTEDVQVLFEAKPGSTTTELRFSSSGRRSISTLPR